MCRKPVGEGANRVTTDSGMSGEWQSHGHGSISRPIYHKPSETEPDYLRVAAWLSGADLADRPRGHQGQARWRLQNRLQQRADAISFATSSRPTSTPKNTPRW